MDPNAPGDWGIYPSKGQFYITRERVAGRKDQDVVASCSSEINAHRVLTAMRLKDRILEMARKLELQADEIDDPMSQGYDPSTVAECRRMARELRDATGQGAGDIPKIDLIAPSRSMECPRCGETLIALSGENLYILFAQHIRTSHDESTGTVPGEAQPE